jgi:ribosomal protein S6
LKTVVKRLYEAMFLVDPLGGKTAASNGVDSGHSAELSRSPTEADWDSISTATRKILEKVGAEIVSMKKWDERRLAYEINGKNRGTYILCYFHADGQKIRQIEREAQLSELILRVLILGTEGRSKEDIERDTCGEVS